MKKENPSSLKKIVKPLAITALCVGAYVVFAKDNSEEYEIETTTSVGNNASLDVTALAQRLHDTMKYMGTDYKEILNTLADKNERDFQAIAKRFGKRAYNKITGNQTRINPLAPLPKYTLKEWLQFELSKSQYETLKSKYPNSL